MTPQQMALMIPILALMIPIIAIIMTTMTKFLKDMAEIRARTAAQPSSQVAEELSKMRREMAELRETSTKFDMSFDAALTRLEQRVDRIEDGNAVAPVRRAVAPVQEESDITLQVRR